MMPSAPGLLSTTTGWPSCLPSAWAMMRVSASAAPPGGKPTTRRRGLLGNDCACALRVRHRTDAGRQGQRATIHWLQHLPDSRSRRRRGRRSTGCRARRLLARSARLGDLDDAAVGIDRTQSPVSMHASGSRSKSVIAGCGRDHGAERDLGGHLVEQPSPPAPVPIERARRGTAPTSPKSLWRPGNTSTLPAKLWPRSSCRVSTMVPVRGVDAAPARDRSRVTSASPSAHAGHDLAAVQHDDLCSWLAALRRVLMRSLPFQRPVQAASMHSAVVPNQACTPRIAGR